MKMMKMKNRFRMVLLSVLCTGPVKVAPQHKRAPEVKLISKRRKK